MQVNDSSPTAERAPLGFTSSVMHAKHACKAVLHSSTVMHDTHACRPVTHTVQQQSARRNWSDGQRSSRQRQAPRLPATPSCCSTTKGAVPLTCADTSLYLWHSGLCTYLYLCNSLLLQYHQRCGAHALSLLQILFSMKLSGVADTSLCQRRRNCSHFVSHRTRQH